MAERIRQFRGTPYDQRGPVCTTIYPVSGGSVDYSYGEHGLWAYVYELGTSHTMPTSEISPTCQEIRPALMFLSSWIFDCNENGVPDAGDIAGGFSQDYNENRTPDECESWAPPGVKSAGSGCIVITPPERALPMALLVTGDADDPNASCAQAYVQSDGRLMEDSPVFQTHDMWGTIEVCDEAIIGATHYQLESTGFHGSGVRRQVEFPRFLIGQSDGAGISRGLRSWWHLRENLEVRFRAQWR